MSQKQTVKQILEKDGEINNLWCLQNGIWRLGAVIKDLRDDGMDIETEYNTKRVGKNTHYKIKRKETLF